MLSIFKVDFAVQQSSMAEVRRGAGAELKVLYVHSRFTVKADIAVKTPYLLQRFRNCVATSRS